MRIPVFFLVSFLAASAEAVTPAPTTSVGVMDVLSHSTMARLLTETGIAISLAPEAPFTVFAPTDTAFAAMPAGKLAFLEQPEHRDRLHGILQRWISAQRFDPTHPPQPLPKTLDQKALDLKTIGGKATLGGAALLTPREAGNSIIYPLAAVPAIDAAVFDPED